MRIVFMGTPALAASVLKALAEQHEVVGVFTRPDAVRGRGKTLVASDVKIAADELGVPVYTPPKLDGEATGELEELDPDVICVVAYGVILPATVVNLPRFGCLNVHASLLPRWRGAAPIERAILSNDEFTGVSIMKMDEGLDTGAYCGQRKTPIGKKGIAALEVEIGQLGAESLLDVLAKLERGIDPLWRAQDDAYVTYANKVEKGELDLDPAKSDGENMRRVQASSDAHPSRAIIAGRTCTIMEVETCGAPVEAASVVWENKRMLLGCVQGSLELKMVKPAGKREMDARSFAAGIKDLKSNTLKWERL